MSHPAPSTHAFSQTPVLVSLGGDITREKLDSALSGTAWSPSAEATQALRAQRAQSFLQARAARTLPRP
jgi:hypothetical protein